jgi:cell division protein ZapA
MAVVDVTVNGRTYQIACDDGEEEHLAELARYFDGQVSEVSGSVGQVGEARLILMAGLLISDELSNSLERIEGLESSATEESDEGKRAVEELTSNLSGALNALAERIETLAARLESA